MSTSRVGTDELNGQRHALRTRCLGVDTHHEGVVTCAGTAPRAGQRASPRRLGSSWVRLRDGQGLRGTVDGRQVALGSEKMLEGLRVEVAPVAESAAELRGRGATVVFVAVDGALAGLLAVADPVKESARSPRALLERGVTHHPRRGVSHPVLKGTVMTCHLRVRPRR